MILGEKMCSLLSWYEKRRMRKLAEELNLSVVYVEVKAGKVLKKKRHYQ